MQKEAGGVNLVRGQPNRKQGKRVNWNIKDLITDTTTKASAKQGKIANG